MNDETQMPDEQFTEDFRVACHEHGHFFACLSFGISASPVVFIEAERYETNVAGACRLDFLADATPFQKSVIGYAGFLAEHLCGVVPRRASNPFPLRETTLREFWSATETGFEAIFGLSDQRFIASYGNRWLAFKGAYFRIIKKRAKIKRLARHTANEKLAERIEFEKAKKAVEELAKNPPKTIPAAASARILADFIEGLHPNDPRRERLAPALASLRRGVVPELNGELTLTTEEMEALKP
ncbi:MAG TPA: hypothetical protein VN836_12100 [Verrucomicrobiae bacterium]|nr:hypothetical protein [Verrucomicrobiae bacterium]